MLLIHFEKLGNFEYTHSGLVHRDVFRSIIQARCSNDDEGFLCLHGPNPSVLRPFALGVIAFPCLEDCVVVDGQNPHDPRCAILPAWFRSTGHAGFLSFNCSSHTCSAFLLVLNS